jgi:hypothetical protein
MKKKYTVDEIINNRFAVLLDRDDESIKLDISLTDIPIKVKEGDILNIEFKDNKIVFAEIDKEETKKTRKEVKDLIDELKKKSSKDLKW